MSRWLRLKKLVEPDRVLDDDGRESVSFVDTDGRLDHTGMVAQSRLN